MPDEELPIEVCAALNDYSAAVADRFLGAASPPRRRDALADIAQEEMRRVAYAAYRAGMGAAAPAKKEPAAMPSRHEDVILALRSAASELENQAARNTHVLFPGWDGTNEPERVDSIRTTAWAILGSNNPDDSVGVRRRDLGRLIRYVADMLE